ncbi:MULTISPECIES: hypothetical protein [Rhodococcus]|uniref:hypothetical protein n=1 Tax=Rhodococcus TaxID=1827 RepID=UPI000C7CC6D1|nr:MULTISPECIES: hypothetical protein [Rhodococcus]AUM16435.1 hypothetical protein CSW53_07800 [Rhodococcus ruber]
MIRRAVGIVVLAATLAACSGTTGTPSPEADPSPYAWVDDLIGEVCFTRDDLRELRDLMVHDPEWASLSPQEQWLFLASIEKHPEDC